MSTKKKRAELFHQSLFLGPAMVFFLIIVIIPFILGVYYSMTNWNGVSSESSWVGLDNYVYLFTDDEEFLKSFNFTFRFTLVSGIINNVLGLGFALLLTQSIKLKNLFRPILLLPNVIGGVILGFIWNFIFVAGFGGIAEATGWSFFSGWLGDSMTGFWGIVIVSAWQGSGYLMIIYIAALIGVERDLVESARIDGASGFKLFRHIHLPLIMPAVTICVFMVLTGGLRIFDVVFSLTSGGPFGSTKSVAYDIWDDFSGVYYGLGTAKSVVLFLAVAIVSVVQVLLMKKKEVAS
ncbi:carbohydrate ABC transporter permease [Gorillibacterium sp. sgz5001074]|uniref:carbohydrate ABC transporter permease n=1 Tax=Gorillibacterium sp. sgz5001074 TaxID=3446695 RepID=UPI003F66DC53